MEQYDMTETFSFSYSHDGGVTTVEHSWPDGTSLLEASAAEPVAFKALPATLPPDTVACYNLLVKISTTDSLQSVDTHSRMTI